MKARKRETNFGRGRDICELERNCMNRYGQIEIATGK